jgi:predicted nucleic acid-binding protein
MSGKGIIIDASAVLAVILEEPEKASIIEATKGVDAKVPGCLQWEVGNAFSAIMKQGRLTGEQIFEALRIFDLIPLQEVEINLAEALEISIRNSIYAYDAYYLSAAKRHRIELLSLDNKMLEVAKVEGIKIKEIK